MIENKVLPQTLDEYLQDDCGFFTPILKLPPPLKTYEFESFAKKILIENDIRFFNCKQELIDKYEQLKNKHFQKVAESLNRIKNIQEGKQRFRNDKLEVLSTHRGSFAAKINFKGSFSFITAIFCKIFPSLKREIEKLDTLESKIRACKKTVVNDKIHYNVERSLINKEIHGMLVNVIRRYHREVGVVCELSPIR